MSWPLPAIIPPPATKARRRPCSIPIRWDCCSSSPKSRAAIFSPAPWSRIISGWNRGLPQYFKLAKKIQTGARFIINQIGYDSRKMDELLKYMASHGLQVPVVANVFVLSAPAARHFHAGKIPGVTVTDELLALAEKHAGSPDRGRSFFLEFAAKQCAIARGLGYRGMYLGGHLRLEDYDRIFHILDSFGSDDWREFARELHFSQPGEFYYFEADAATGLCSADVNRDYLRSKQHSPAAPFAYKANRLIHRLAFEEGRAGFRAGQALYQIVERSPKLANAIHGAEHALKMLSFDCRDCGDCSLPEIAYLCPESQCAKNQRNGPCGGTHQGRCEVGEKECIWARAYNRLKAYGEEERMLEGRWFTKMARSREPAAGRTLFWAGIIGARIRVHHEATRFESSVLCHRREHPHHAGRPARGKTGSHSAERRGSGSLLDLHRRDALSEHSRGIQKPSGLSGGESQACHDRRAHGDVRCGTAACEAALYLRTLAEKQIRAGADFLDLNVDELSWNRDEQKAAIAWLVRAVEPLSSVPLSIDSSNLEILLTGIEACRGIQGKPLLNSASSSGSTRSISSSVMNFPW